MRDYLTRTRSRHSARRSGHDTELRAGKSKNDDEESRRPPSKMNMNRAVHFMSLEVSPRCSGPYGLNSSPVHHQPLSQLLDINVAKNVNSPNLTHHVFTFFASANLSSLPFLFSPEFSCSPLPNPGPVCMTGVGNVNGLGSILLSGPLLPKPHSG